MPIQFSNATTHSLVSDNLAFLDHPSSSTFRILSTPRSAWLCHPGLKQVIPRGHFSPQTASAA